MHPEALSDFTQLVQRHADQWYRVALRIVLDHSSAQDCVQDASIKMWSNWSSFRGDAQRSTWAYRFVVNEALSAKRRNRPVATTDPAELAAVPDSPYFEADAALTALYQAVASLPERQRLVFQLRYFDELPYADIASVLGTSEGGLKANYHHAVAKIKKTMVGLNLDLHSES
jgi:RNA polymerase sigma-70 factor (ECF subfamily)